MSTSKSFGTVMFDYKLLTLGNWEKKQLDEIENWIKMPEDQKKEVASALMSSLIQDLLSKDCTLEGKKCSRNLGTTLSHLEELLHTTRGGLLKKFYRDHLNHMLRVMLLARAASTKMNNLGFDESEIRLLTLAALFHDIAYPLSEITQVFGGVTEALNNCYRSLSYPQLVISLNMKIATQLIQNANLPKNMTISGLGRYFAESNHGLFSAMEFLQYIKPEMIENYRASLDAIMFHDPDFDFVINAKENKVLALLIICDEMQDWGRPASFEQEPTISEIKDFEIKPDQINGRFVWDNASLLSPLRQIYSKQKSLRRIDFSPFEKDVKLNLTFDLPSYDTFDIGSLERVLQKIYSQWNSLETVTKIVKEPVVINTYQKIYYGAIGEKEPQLLKELEKGTLEKNSVFNINKVSYYNVTRKEILLTSQNCGLPRKIKIGLDKKGLKTEFIGEKSNFIGQITSEPLEPSSTFTKYLISELFLFDVTVKQRYNEGKSEINAANLLVSDTKISEFLRMKENNADEIISMLETLSKIRYCLKEKGFFVFS